MAEKIIRIRNYAFLIWKIFDTPTDKINLNIINNKILTGNSNNTASSYGIDDISDLNNNYSRSLSSLPLSSIPLQVPEQLSPLLLSHLNTCSTLKVPLPMNISNNITTSTLPVPQDMNPVMNLLSSASVVSDVSESVFSDASISYEVTKKKRKRGKNHQKCLLENGNESPKKMKNVKYSKKKDHKKEDFETYY